MDTMNFETFLKAWYETHIADMPQIAEGYTEITDDYSIEHLPYTFECFSNSPLAQASRSAFEAASFNAYTQGVVAGALIATQPSN
jgi:hypothetical protein